MQVREIHFLFKILEPDLSQGGHLGLERFFSCVDRSRPPKMNFKITITAIHAMQILAFTFSGGKISRKGCFGCESDAEAFHFGAF